MHKAYKKQKKNLLMEWKNISVNYIFDNELKARILFIWKQ